MVSISTHVTDPTACRCSNHTHTHDYIRPINNSGMHDMGTPACTGWCSTHHAHTVHHSQQPAVTTTSTAGRRPGDHRPSARGQAGTTIKQLTHTGTPCPPAPAFSQLGCQLSYPQPNSHRHSITPLTIITTKGGTQQRSPTTTAAPRLDAFAQRLQEHRLGVRPPSWSAMCIGNTVTSRLHNAPQQQTPCCSPVYTMPLQHTHDTYAPQTSHMITVQQQRGLSISSLI